MTDSVSKTDDLEHASDEEEALGAEPNAEGVGPGDAPEADADNQLEDGAEEREHDLDGEEPVAEGDEDPLGPHEPVAADEKEAAEPPPGDSEFAALREDFEELNDRHLRLAAEFNNFRRRSEQERLESWSRARADLLGDFIEVLDDLHRVADLDLSNATVEAIMEGIDLVERKFMRVLTDAGVEIIDPVGELFDPEQMEAMMRVPAEREEDDDTVAMVLQKGYSLKGILVRPARVSVHKHG